MVKRILITCSLIFAAMTATVFAEEEGYIFKLKDDAVIPFSVVDGVERISSDEAIYSADTLEAVYEFAGESAIECIGRDARVYLYGDDFGGTPNDPFYAQYQWNLPMINMPAVWKKGYRGEGAEVCVIDSGLTNHEDIDQDRVVGTYNVFYGDNDVTDEIDHGTFVTGTVIAETNNRIGIAGIADKADIVSIKTFDNIHDTDIANLISALSKASEYEDLDVINMSLGTKGDIDPKIKEMFESSINKLTDKGVIVIAAVGNDGNDTLSYPAAFDNVIGVGAVAKNKNKCSFSQMNESVFVVAPGGVEKKGGSDGLAGLVNDGSNVGVGSGTSYAAPHVTAVAAIAKSIYPELTTEQFKEILKNTSEDLGVTGYDTYYGWGLIDAEKVVEEVEKLAPTPTAEPTAEPTASPDADFDPDMYRELKYDSDSNSITVDTDDTEAVVYAPRYESDGTLAGVKSYKISDLTGDNGVYTITLESGEKEPSKLFLWHGIRSCIESWEKEDIPEPTAEPSVEPTIEPTAEPSAEPTVEPDSEELQSVWVVGYSSTAIKNIKR